MGSVVVYDANVLYPNALRDLLIRVARARSVQAKWTDEILDEVFEHLVENRPDLDPDRLARTRQLMVRAIPDCMVREYQPLVPVLSLPDPADRHVLAAAVKAHAQVIVTADVKDFPAEQRAPWDIEAKHPDDFLLDQIDLGQASVLAALRAVAAAREAPPTTPLQVLNELAKQVPRTAVRLGDASI